MQLLKVLMCLCLVLLVISADAILLVNADAARELVQYNINFFIVKWNLINNYELQGTIKNVTIFAGISF